MSCYDLQQDIPPEVSYDLCEETPVREAYIADEDEDVIRHIYIDNIKDVFKVETKTPARITHGLDDIDILMMDENEKHLRWRIEGIVSKTKPSEVSEKLADISRSQSPYTPNQIVEFLEQYEDLEKDEETWITKTNNYMTLEEKFIINNYPMTSKIFVSVWSNKHWIVLSETFLSGKPVSFGLSYCLADTAFGISKDYGQEGEFYEDPEEDYYDNGY